MGAVERDYVCKLCCCHFRLTDCRYKHPLKWRTGTNYLSFRSASMSSPLVSRQNAQITPHTKNPAANRIIAGVIKSLASISPVSIVVATLASLFAVLQSPHPKLRQLDI
jgi:hypothetical protein